MKGFDIIFKPGYNYLKCGIIVHDLVPENQIQLSLFDNINRPKSKTAMGAVDKVNSTFGKDLVRFAAQGFEKKFRLKQSFLSKRYTTHIDEIITIKN